MTDGRIVLVGGARPNFMKVAPVFRALSRAGRKTAFVHTGQHYDDAMSAIFFEQLGLPPPDACLNVGSGSHGAQAGRVMMAFEDYLLANPKPAGVVVVGDVNSTAACAMTAVKLGIPVAHVEAGLRSFDRTMPEEINRLVTDAIVDLLLVSEPSGLDNLRREGAATSRVHYVGNVMIDTLVQEREAARALDILRHLALTRKHFVLITLHRPSNVDERRPLAEIVEFVLELAKRFEVVLPVHPRTRTRLAEFQLMERLSTPRIRVLDPIGYREMLALMDAARLVVTDSGGVQEETTFLDVPCLTLRENTERPITVTHGTNTVLGRDFARAWRTIGDIERGCYKTSRPIDGWDGGAATRIVGVLSHAWS
jgi:UDP-N-acetylglucosamine 2-epimerase (non-hydrolysing)